MRLVTTPGRVHVYLSERNLLSLLSKVRGHPRGSACTITNEWPEAPVLLVTAELDSVHYSDPDREGEPPGPMHPDTEGSLGSVMDRDGPHGLLDERNRERRR